MNTGIVTTTRVTHATPAGVYAHVPHRSYENDAAIPINCRNDPHSNFRDIAHQLVYGEEGSKLKVILGCGRREFINSTMRDDENRSGFRSDGRNLINEWLSERRRVGNASYVWHKQQLDEVNVQETDYLLGLFEHTHCMYRNDIIDGKLLDQEPLLTDMTRVALRMLQKDDKGYFLMVEGGRIDHSHHANRARQALDETAEFARAIALAKQMTNSEDTLIVVTSDHSHVNTYAGYPVRRNDVLKTSGRAQDHFPYETISYGNGPSYSITFDEDGNRVDVTNDDFSASRRANQATVPLSSETHAGEDVAVYANGPWSHLFQGSYEQSVIPIAMAYAAQIGPYKMKLPIVPIEVK
jgi:alkaline phosphatase